LRSIPAAFAGQNAPQQLTNTAMIKARLIRLARGTPLNFILPALQVSA
jgi:hypothetical protein